MTFQVAYEAKDYEFQSRVFKKTISQNNNEEQLDVLIRLRKLLILKISFLS